jgi:hypothetical protein
MLGEAVFFMFLMRAKSYKVCFIFKYCLLAKQSDYRFILCSDILQYIIPKIALDTSVNCGIFRIFDDGTRRTKREQGTRRAVAREGLESLSPAAVGKARREGGVF